MAIYLKLLGKNRRQFFKIEKACYTIGNFHKKGCGQNVDLPHLGIYLPLMLLCIAVSGFFSLAEVAINESIVSKIDRLVLDGNKAAKAAEKILDDPEPVLSVAQIGISLMSIICGALTGAYFAPILTAFLPAPFTLPLSLVICVPLVTYLNLLLGEFLPKKLAYQDPERYLLLFAGTLLKLQSILKPFAMILSGSTNSLLLIFGFNPQVDDSVTEDEVKDLIEQGMEDGTFEKTEQDMIDHIFHMSDQTAYSLMTPRTQMLWLDLEDDEKENLELIKQNPTTVFPVGKDNLDAFCGIIYAKDLLNAAIDKKELKLVDFIKKPLLIPRSMDTFRVLEKFRESCVHEAIVLDEYGGVVGFITLGDIIEEIIGETISTDETEPDYIIKRNENVWIIDGLCPIDDFKEAFNLEELPDEDKDHYQTVGGFMTSYIGCIPRQHDTCAYKGLTFEIMNMDRARVAKILVTKKKRQEAH